LVGIDGFSCWLAGEYGCSCSDRFGDGVAGADGIDRDVV
jgi:hypothetical protein